MTTVALCIASGAVGIAVGAVVVACLVAGGDADRELERIARDRPTDLGA